MNTNPCGLAELSLPLMFRCAIFRYEGVHEAVTQWSVYGRGFSSPGVSRLIMIPDVNTKSKVLNVLVECITRMLWFHGYDSLLTNPTASRSYHPVL